MVLNPMDGAALEPEESLHGVPNGSNRSVWYRWTAPRMGWRSSPSPGHPILPSWRRDRRARHRTAGHGSARRGRIRGNTPFRLERSLSLMVGDAYGPDAAVTFRLRFVPHSVQRPLDGSPKRSRTTDPKFTEPDSATSDVTGTNRPEGGRRFGTSDGHRQWTSQCRVRSLIHSKPPAFPLVFRGAFPRTPGHGWTPLSDIPSLLGNPNAHLSKLAPDASPCGWNSAQPRT